MVGGRLQRYRASGSVTVTVGGTPTTTTTNYLTDTNNPTGYTQVLEEHTSGTAPNMSYIIGLSVVAQTNASGTTSYLMPDALGSTRLVVDPSGTITVRYQYDAYGNVLGVALGLLSPPATEILYNGQFFVLATLQYNLRARIWLDVPAKLVVSQKFNSLAIQELREILRAPLRSRLGNPWSCVLIESCSNHPAHSASVLFFVFEFRIRVSTPPPLISGSVDKDHEPKALRYQDLWRTYPPIKPLITGSVDEWRKFKI
jgi:YD repeat-containing protein